MSKLKGISVLLIIFLAMGALLVGGLKYRTTYAKTEILSVSSIDGQYTLFVYMIGEPDWPFGATHCRFDLMNADKRITRYPFDIHDDGATAHENNFDISWEEDYVTIIVSGSEQKDIVYQLSFDGNVEYWHEEELSSADQDSIASNSAEANLPETGFPKSESPEQESAEQTACECADDEYPRMIMVQDILYYDCTEINTEPRCGMLDGTIDKMAKEVPVENNQSNFGVGYGYQFGGETGIIEVCIDDEWHIFKEYVPGTFKIVDEYLSIYYRTEKNFIGLKSSEDILKGTPT